MAAPWTLETLAFGRAAASSAVYRIAGHLAVGVTAKATFSLQQGRDAAPEAPEPLTAKDHYYDRDPSRSVEIPSDLAPYKSRGEVVLRGHAHAPGGRPTPTAAVRLFIGGAEATIDKTLHVYGERRAPHDAPEPFQRMPLVWERAVGGEHTDNPVGVPAGGPRQPNLVDPTDPSRPACFAAISPYWRARKKRLPASQRRGTDQRIPELPEGFDFDYYLCAPEDQRTSLFHGDEWIVLDGMHPALPRLQSRLPGARGGARIVLPGRAPLAVALALDTLVIDADRLTLSAIWRGLFKGASETELAGARVLAGIGIGNEALDWPDVSAVSLPPEVAASEELDVEPDRDAANPLMRTIGLSPDDAMAAIRKAAIPFAARSIQDSGAREEAPPGSTSALPFRAPAAPPSSRAPAPVPAPPPVQSPSSPWATGAPSAPPRAEPQAPAPPAPPSVHYAPPPPPPSAALPPPPAPSAMPAPPASVALPPIAPPPPRTAPPAIVTPPTSPATAEISPVAPRPPAPPAKPPPRGDKAAVPIVNPTSLIAVTVPWQMRPPKDSLTIVVKGTFDLVDDGPAVLREEGEFPIGDVHVDDDPAKSLAYGSDLGIFKPKADVTLTGTAYAPSAARGATPAMQVELRFGAGSSGFVRRIVVMGDRRWQKALLTLAPTAPEPFAAIPLTWERAFGGPEFEANPSGAGHRAHAGEDGVARLPNLEDPAHLVGSPGDAPAPACFAPVGMLWKERWSKLGTYDRRWFKVRWPYFPEDFDWAFYQNAPRAQQLPYLTGDEPYSLVGMRPDTPRVDGRLPGIRARCFLQMTEEAGAAFREVPLVLDTAAFDVDAMKLCLVWRAFVEVSDEEAPEIEALFIAREALGATPLTLDQARAQYVAAATPAPPEETSPESPPPAERTVDPESVEKPADTTRAEILEQLKAAGVPLRETGLDAPPEPPPPFDPAAIEASLRGAGASDEQVSEVLAALTPPPDDGDGAAKAVDLRAAVIARLAEGEPFDGLDLAGAELSDLDFSGRSLAQTVLVGASLARCSFAGAKLEGANLARADLTEAIFTGADLSGAHLAGVKAPRANLTGANLTDTDLTGADLEGAVLSGVHGTSTQFEGCRLAGASFRDAKLEDADFTRAALDGAVFERASLPQVRLYDVRGPGASFQGASMPGARVEGAKLTKATFAGVKAPGSVWERALLNEASFHGAVLTGASFARATCLKTIFSTADLTSARFRRANLGGASFLHTNLMMATFERADLTLADLRGANLHTAETWKAKLDHAKLDQAIVTQTKLK